ncbi:MAG: gamma-glutamyltransferase [Vulcanimicrobiota bacterium]
MTEDLLPAHLRAPFPCLGRRGMAVSDHPLASQAACDMLAAGGSAVDGAIALSLTLGCACPYYAGIGGGGFGLVWMPGWEAPRWLDFRETAPACAHERTYEDLPDTASTQGIHSVGVPGMLAGLGELHARFGRLPWKELFQPAIAAASGGVPVDPNWHRISLSKEPLLAKFPEAARIYLPEGSSPFPGTPVPLPDLAATYEHLAQEGPAAFYKGPLARRLLDCLEGWITQQDLDDYRIRWRQPLAMDWRGGRLHTVSSPSAGGLQLLQILGLMERRGGPDSSAEDNAHWLTEAMRVSFRDRIQVAGDPEFGGPDPGQYLAQDWFEEWSARLSQNAVVPLSGPTLAYASGGTASHVVAAADGGVVVITESINHWFGSFLVPSGTGVLLNNIMDDFTTHAHRPDGFHLAPAPWNLVQAGKRPVSSSTPAMWMQRGKPRLVVGSAGGPRITTSVAQILLNSVWHQMNVQQAVSAPRLHHQWYPDHLEVEPQVPENLRQSMRARGHHVQEHACRSHASALECHWDEGFFSGGADFRSFGAARGL